MGEKGERLDEERKKENKEDLSLTLLFHLVADVILVTSPRYAKR